MHIGSDAWKCTWDVGNSSNYMGDDSKLGEARLGLISDDEGRSRHEESEVLRHSMCMWRINRPCGGSIAHASHRNIRGCMLPRLVRIQIQCLMFTTMLAPSPLPAPLSVTPADGTQGKVMNKIAYKASSEELAHLPDVVANPCDLLVAPSSPRLGLSTGQPASGKTPWQRLCLLQSQLTEQQHLSQRPSSQSSPSYETTMGVM